jgi:hypothetical protein
MSMIWLLNIVHLKSSNSTSKINVELPGINPSPTPLLPIEKTLKIEFHQIKLLP